MMSLVHHLPVIVAGKRVRAEWVRSCTTVMDRINTSNWGTKPTSRCCWDNDNGADSVIGSEDELLPPAPPSTPSSPLPPLLLLLFLTNPTPVVVVVAVVAVAVARNSMDPEVIVSRPSKQFIMDVLPAPEPPKIAVNLPGRIIPEKERDRRKGKGWG